MCNSQSYLGGDNNNKKFVRVILRQRKNLKKFSTEKQKKQLVCCTEYDDVNLFFPLFETIFVFSGFYTPRALYPFKVDCFCFFSIFMAVCVCVCMSIHHFIRDRSWDTL